MKHIEMSAAVAIAGVLAAGGVAMAQPKQAPVDIEMMTYPEIHAAIHEHGKTTVPAAT